MYKYYHIVVCEIVDELNAIFETRFMIHGFIPYFDVFVGENWNGLELLYLCWCVLCYYLYMR